MAIKLIVFDCDGVLFDSFRANAAYYNHLAEKFGRGPLTPDEERYIHIHTVFESVDHVFRDDPETIKRVMEYRTGLTYVPFIKLLDPEPGVIDCLDRLRSADFQLAVFTNRSDTIYPVLETHHMADYFMKVVSCLDVKQAKPAPEGMNLILDAAGRTRDEAVYIGDSPSDKLAAENAGTEFIAYKDPGLGAVHNLDHFDRFESVLREIENGAGSR